MRTKYIMSATAVIVVLLGGFLVYFLNKQPQETSSANSKPANPLIATRTISPASSAPFTAPLDRAKERVTKKPLGLYVTPKTSSVQPEKFTGYHSGVDFETFPDEQTIDVPIKAVCSGKLLVKRMASGYGGVAVQACTLNGQPVTVVYGHMRLASISRQAGESLTAGDQLGVLGTGYSAETDGERKHLHLGIHKGSAIDIKGYVQNQADLANWLNILDYI